MWKTESSYGLSPPQKIYCSPLTRALHTCDIMLDGVFQSGHVPVTVVEASTNNFISSTIIKIEYSIYQNCREENGVHTCDKRQTRTYITTSYPHFIIEDGFTELDELWSPTVRESEEQVAERARKVLDVVFQNDIDTQCKIYSCPFHSFFK
jgi:hypothetical protein